MLYLRLLHGRNSPDEEMSDWGFQGPVLGPLDYVHVTYSSHVNIGEEYDHLYIYEGLLVYDEKYYGDWEVITEKYVKEVDLQVTKPKNDWVRT